jgi:hypothetical protein
MATTKWGDRIERERELMYSWAQRAKALKQQRQELFDKVMTEANIQAHRKITDKLMKANYYYSKHELNLKDLIVKWNIDFFKGWEHQKKGK